MECRKNCGACCIAPSISSALPGMLNGKPAGIPCVNLKPDYSCAAYELRPPVCRGYQASEDCGSTREEAMKFLSQLEKATL